MACPPPAARPALPLCFTSPPPARGVLSWAKLIARHAKDGRNEEALEAYSRMREQGLTPTIHTFAAALRACAAIADLQSGRHVHAHAVRAGCQQHPFVANSLVHMYAGCGSPADARRVFDGIRRHDVVSWNAMIAGYARTGMAALALELFARMPGEGFVPGPRAFVAALKACGCLAAQGPEAAEEEEEKGAGGAKGARALCLRQGRAIHGEAAKCGFESQAHVANALLDMYARCGGMEDARRLFEGMAHRDVISWTSMITGYARLEMGNSAMELYASMRGSGPTPNARTFVAVLMACGSMATRRGSEIDCTALEQGRAVHAELAGRGLEQDVFVASTLVDMYAKCRCIGDARRVFDKMNRRNVVSWNAMIMGYAQMSMGHSALELYARMQNEGFPPNARTFIAALAACGSLAEQGEGKGVRNECEKKKYLKQGRAIHTAVVKRGFESDVFVASTLVDMYAKCGSMEDACDVFGKMTHKNVVSWTAIILGYTQMEMGDLALKLYERMRSEGLTPNARTYVAALTACSSMGGQEGNGFDTNARKATYLDRGRTIHAELVKRGFESDVFVANTLVDMYAKCGSADDAYRIFEKMRYRDVVSWNTMITGYAQRETGDSALALYARMQDEGFIPDAHTFAAALKACSSLASLETGKQIHSQIRRIGLQGELLIANLLVDMYAKCGSMADAQQFFDSLRVRDSVTWSTLIAGYSGQGSSRHSFNIYERMVWEGIKPDGVTFVSVLTICNRSGLISEGQRCFRDMRFEYGIPPSAKHYMCMADLLGRAGQLDEAMALVKAMPFYPETVTWLTVLGACRKWSNVEAGRHAFECAVALDESFASAYVLMLNIYVTARMWDESARIEEMRAKAVAHGPVTLE